MKVMIHDLDEGTAFTPGKSDMDSVIIHANNQSICSLPRLLSVLAEECWLLCHEGFFAAHWSAHWSE